MQLRIPYAKSFPNMHFLGLNYDNETLIYYRSALNIHSNFFPFKMTFRGSFEAKNSTFSCQANISLTRQRMHFRQFFKVALYFTCILQKSFRDPKLKRFEILNDNYCIKGIMYSILSQFQILYAYFAKLTQGARKNFKWFMVSFLFAFRERLTQHSWACYYQVF